QQRTLGEGTQQWIFLLFAAAFLVKAPVFPLHGWMPDAYRAAPLPVLVVFSAIVSKVGVYGFLRIVLPILPGIFSLDPKGSQGAVMQMVNHGLVTAGLFFAIAALARRAGGSELLSRM